MKRLARLKTKCNETYFTIDIKNLLPNFIANITVFRQPLVKSITKVIAIDISELK